MAEKRYTLKAVGEALGLSAATVQHRAHMLKIHAQYGLTAGDAMRIRDYKTRRQRATVDELKKEMEELTHE